MIILGLITLFMGYKAQDIEWSYDMANIVPEDDPEQQFFKEFRQTFGEDGNIMAIGVLDTEVYKVQNFQKEFCQII